MTPKLSPRTRQLAEIIFPSDQASEAMQWLEDECGNNLPFQKDSDEFQMERIRFAALKLSAGNISALLKTVDEARMDWRDVLMAAGFGTDLSAHEFWANEILNQP